MSTHELFKKHFGNVAEVGMKHPNMESFFEELNAECLEEDKHKNCNIPCVSNSVCDDNPYLLTGEELDRTEAFRKAGRF